MEILAHNGDRTAVVGSWFSVCGSKVKQLLKNAFLWGFIVQLLFLGETLSLLDGKRHFKMLIIGLTAWNIVWLVLYVLSHLFPHAKNIRAIHSSILVAVAAPLAIYIAVNIGGSELWRVIGPWLGDKTLERLNGL